MNDPLDSREILNASLLRVAQVPQEEHDVMLMFTVQLDSLNYCQFVQSVLSISGNVFKLVVARITNGSIVFENRPKTGPIFSKRAIAAKE